MGNNILNVQVGAAPTVIRTPGSNLENQVINNPGPVTVYLGGPAVTPATGLAFTPGSELHLYKNATPIYGCVPGATPWASAPSLAATGVSMTNTSGQPVAVTVAGGTVTVISVGGTTQSANGTNITSGTFVVPAAGTIAITYSVAPTLSWLLARQAVLTLQPAVQSS